MMKMGDKAKVLETIMTLTGELRTSSFMRYFGNDGRRKELLARAEAALEAYKKRLPEELRESFEDMAEQQEDLKEYDLRLTYIVGMMDCIDLMQNLGFLEVYADSGTTGN